MTGKEEGEKRVYSSQALLLGTTWGPFPGKIEPVNGENDKVSLELTGAPRWLMVISRVSAEDENFNCSVYSRDGQVWCSTIKNISEGDELAACVVDLPSHLLSPAQTPYGLGMYPSRLLDGIQLLPQQAAMASILPGAIINKDIFPCKTCGIWFRSERNLQAHLMYYCSGRQREPEMMAEKNCSTALPMFHSCTYPQCNMSFAGSHALEMHLSTHHSPKSEENSTASNLKCTICDFAAENLIVLQTHILSHLSKTGLKCGHCHFSFKSPAELAKHQELHGHNGRIPSKLLKEDTQKVTGILCKNDYKESRGQHFQSQSSDMESLETAHLTNKCEGTSGKKSNLSHSNVKSEPSSPRLASSPIHLPPAFPLPPFMPHLPFSQDITVGPQASEILAKMSELVHRRLHHGGNAYPPVMYSTLLPKGTTCFECSITFNNLDNYLVHKKHYCNSRWENTHKLHEFPGILDKPAGNASPKIGESLAIMLNANQSSEWKGHEPKTCNLAAGVKIADELSVQIKKASTPSGTHERPNGMPLENQKMPPTETDPSHTTCDACKITFSRHETYMVHKQFYCATRHDPQIRRTNNKGPANQKAVRPRKRRKVFELASPEQDHIPPMGIASFFGMSNIGNPHLSNNQLENLRDNQKYNMIQGFLPKYPEASLTVAKSALVSECYTISNNENDAPMDLSKKCALQISNSPVSPKRLMDYHECVVCKISFNKVEDYLKHKQIFCLGPKVHISENKDLKKESPRFSKNLLEQTLFELQRPHLKIDSPNAMLIFNTQSSNKEPTTPTKEDTSNISENYPSPAKKMRSDEQIWPYYEIKPTDYATGMLGSQSDQRQSPNEGIEGEQDQPMPDGSYLCPDKPDNQRKSSAFKNNLDLENIKAEVESDLLSTESNLEEPIDSNESKALISSLKSEEDSTSFKKVLNASIVSTNNVKYCRPCDIQFNNLSNFITHKKFYCSSHTAEHVK